MRLSLEELCLLPCFYTLDQGFPGGSMEKNLPASLGVADLISGLERSPGERNGNPLLYSCLENPMDRMSLVGYSPWSHRRVRHKLANKQQRQYVRLCCALSHSVVSDSLGPHGLQHARLPCPSPTPRAYPNSCPLSRWCHPTISSSVISFSSCPQSFPASGAFQISQLFTSGGQRLEFQLQISPSSEHPGMNSFRMDWLDLLSFSSN